MNKLNFALSIGLLAVVWRLTGGRLSLHGRALRPHDRLIGPVRIELPAGTGKCVSRQQRKVPEAVQRSGPADGRGVHLNAARCPLGLAAGRVCVL